MKTICGEGINAGKLHITKKIVRHFDLNHLKCEQ